MVSCSRGKQSMRPPKCCRVEDVLTLFEKSGEESAGDDFSDEYQRSKSRSRSNVRLDLGHPHQMLIFQPLDLLIMTQVAILCCNCVFFLEALTLSIFSTFFYFKV